MLFVFFKVVEYELRIEGIMYDDLVLWNILVCGLCDDCYMVNFIYKNFLLYIKDCYLQIKVFIEINIYVEVLRFLYIMFFIFFLDDKYKLLMYIVGLFFMFIYYLYIEYDDLK